MSRCICVDRGPVGNFELTPSELIVGLNVRGPGKRRREGVGLLGKRKKQRGGQRYSELHISLSCEIKF
ncbi:hypothetical protein ANAPRD1_01158 [Anaplasma phagocytophilum]|nr:hypothetical protein ANAPRD1_01158 [Anaplasma phagocytophilum]